MTFDEFKSSIKFEQPPAVNDLLGSLWYDARGDWKKAHQLAQNIENKDGARIHAYLHRKEGDEWNAGYWYRRAGEEFFNGSLDEEWEMLVKKFI